MKTRTNWKQNNIAPVKHCKDEIKCCGLTDTKHKDRLLWFSNDKDLEYICEALNFYDTYQPIFEFLREQCERMLFYTTQESDDDDK